MRHTVVASEGASANKPADGYFLKRATGYFYAAGTFITSTPLHPELATIRPRVDGSLTANASA